MSAKVKKHKIKGPYEAFGKRAIDVLVSLFVFFLFWWLFLIIALLVRVFLGSPVLFEQNRPGKNGKIFKMYKFRSMNDKKDKDGNLLPDSQRLNKFGKLLRSSSLDELPEFYNILKGDMSFVGPRPLLVSYLKDYNDFEMRRHEVRPGLTGLAQVHGRRAALWKDKFEKDVEYVDNITLANDLSIIMLTVKKVLHRDGVENVKTNQYIKDYFQEQGALRAGSSVRKNK